MSIIYVLFPDFSKNSPKDKLLGCFSNLLITHGFRRGVFEIKKPSSMDLAWLFESASTILYKFLHSFKIIKITEKPP